MVPKLTSVSHAGGYRLHVGFADGVEGIVDLRDVLWGEVFEPLADPDLFRRFRLDLELNTIIWPTGADLAPEFLYERAARGAERSSAGA